jgi:hypothetical protein
MCDPFSITAIALTVAGGLYQADAQKEAGRAQVIMAERNAKLETQKGELANRIGAVAEENHRAKVRGMLGTQRAALAANGIDPNSGTALALQDETVAFGETDAMTIRYNAAREAWGYGVNATNFATDAAVTRATTKNAVKGTYLTTAANAFSMGASAWQSGAPAGGGTTYQASSGMSYQVPTTSSGAGWSNAYGGR